MASAEQPAGKTRSLNSRELSVMDRIESVLVAKGLSWSQLARDVGKSTASGGQWSGRRVFPREDTIYRIATRLEVPMAYLLTGDEPTARTQAQTENELVALELVRELSPSEQLAALAVIRGLKGTLTRR